MENTKTPSTAWKETIASDEKERFARQAEKITEVKLPGEKIMMYEEDDSTIDDGAGNPYNGANLLSIRHERKYDLPANDKEKNLGKRGNVSFCDGHVDYVPRKLLYPGANNYNGDAFIRDRYINPRFPQRRYPY